MHRLVDPGPLQPAAYRRGTAEHPLDPVRGAAQQRAEHAPRGVRLGRRQHRPVGVREVPDVGQHPDAQVGPAEGVRPDRDQEYAGSGQATEECSPPRERHARIRRSVGSLPILTINR